LGRAGNALTIKRTLLLAAAVLALAPTADAARPYLGIRGNAARFQSLTGQQSAVGHVIVGWGQGYSWGTPMGALLPKLAPIPMVALQTRRGGPSSAEVISPRAIAMGQGDDYLLALNKAISEWARPIYLRPYAEMNGHWNAYCAYTQGGRLKGASHSTAMFKKAFARTYLIAHGGPAAVVNKSLRALGLPPIRADLPENPLPTLKVIWNPQGHGSPNIPGNSAQAYYPGDKYVDMVGNDLYNIRFKAEWASNERLYNAHPSKPFGFPEWGNWGIDDPSFIKKMAQFVKTHRRVELLAWFDSKPGSIWDLGSKPKSRAAYRRFVVPLGRKA
jgi:Glycosyl hydrolase family 26